MLNKYNQCSSRYVLSPVVTLLFIYISLLKCSHTSIIQGDYSIQSLQTMVDLEKKMASEDFKKFSENSYFTFRCTSLEFGLKFWPGQT